VDCLFVFVDYSVLYTYRSWYDRTICMYCVYEYSTVEFCFLFTDKKVYTVVRLLWYSSWGHVGQYWVDRYNPEREHQ